MDSPFEGTTSFQIPNFLYLFLKEIKVLSSFVHSQHIFQKMFQTNVIFLFHQNASTFSLFFIVRAHFPRLVLIILELKLNFQIQTTISKFQLHLFFVFRYVFLFRAMLLTDKQTYVRKIRNELSRKFLNLYNKISFLT